MNYKILKNIKILFLINLLFLISACEEKNNISDPVDTNIPASGLIEITFNVPLGGLLIDGCVKRFSLDLAYNSDDLYRENFFHSFNVSDEKETYTLRLPPGSYYYQAVIICICETTNCSALQYPGGQFGIRAAADKFEIVENKITSSSPSFH